MDGVELVFDDEALSAVADLAIKRGTGARGLRAILEEILLNTMFDMPSRSDIARVLVDADVVRNKTNPTLVPVQEIARERSA
jgi:ATP-dependent Clp protease ATP-binding subunit ClpX